MFSAIRYHLLIAAAIALICVWLWLAVWWYECHSKKYEARLRYVAPPAMPAICYVLRTDR